ncbi:MAG: arylsulfatase [Verrucomicrobiota bacterium]
MKRNTSTIVAVTLATLVLLAVPSMAGDQPVKPNIILVMPDDLGYGDYSCLGNPVMKTPAVDAFSRQSVRFTDFHVSPTCSPTRAALLTGRHEFKNGVTHTILERERLALKSITLAQMLKSAGYTTGIFGKWHLGDEAPYQPDQRGFDEVFIHGGGGIGQTYPGSCGDVPGNLYLNPTLLHNGRFEKTQGYCTDVFFRQALKWMDAQRKGGAPFFAYIPLNVAHEPLQCPEENYRHYAGQVPEKVARFYGMIETVDRNFGLLLAKLQEWGIDQNTLVIFIGSDNGGYAPALKIFDAGMRGGKGTPYQGGTRVPCFWRWPARFAESRDVPALTAHLDVFPTLAAIAGVSLAGDLARQVEGRNLMPLLSNTKAEWPDRFLVTHVGRWPLGAAADAKHVKCSIRDQRFTLVNNQELYDLQRDPREANNLIAEQPEAVARLRAAYDQWWKEVQPLLVNETATAPAVNPFKEKFWHQFGGEPSAEDLRLMDRARIPELTGEKSPRPRN